VFGIAITKHFVECSSVKWSISSGICLGSRNSLIAFQTPLNPIYCTLIIMLFMCIPSKKRDLPVLKHYQNQNIDCGVSNKVLYISVILHL
jgi:hypothetical protein